MENGEIEVAQPNPNSGNGQQTPSQPNSIAYPPEYSSVNLNAVITVLPDNRIQIVIQDSIRTITYFVTPTNDYFLKIESLLPIGMAAINGNNGEIFIEPTHLN